MRPPVSSLLAVLCLGVAVQASPVLRDVELSLTNDVGFGNEVCVVGPHPLLGGNDPLKAVKLAWNPGNVWRGTIALPAGANPGFKFVRRSFATTNWSGGATTDLLTNQTALVPAHVPAPWNGKTVFLHSTWNQANIYYRDLTAGQTNWTTMPMRNVGAGRSASEKLFRADGVATVGGELEFVFNDGASWLNAPAPPSAAPYSGLAAPFNFRTTLDVFFVQDQQVFNYRPPPSVSAPSFTTRTIGSTVTNIPGRTITIQLPRGYAENTWKRYPVVYFHDGQNVFFPGGPFGTWDADRIAAHESGQGRMREAILVAIPNGNALGSDRLQEYLPNGDTITLYGSNSVIHPGKAAKYAQFLVDNVLPTLDFNFRTLSGAADTVVAGSSMGGLASDYIGHTRGDRFGAAGIFSPAFWAAPNYLTNRTLTLQALRRYLYMGTAESSSGESSSNVYWQGALNAYNSYLQVGQAVNRSLIFEGGAGGQHNEPNWSRRLPSFFAWALDPWREANPLALENFPPTLRIEPGTSAAGVTLRRQRLFGCRQDLLSTTDFAAWQTNALSPAMDAWDEATNTVTPGPAPGRFWSLRTLSRP
jgi:predicted alpha/beta superfamily hydrolase